ncbi:hypothetical protein C8R43DRAFT_882102, partial [Mycena crocata]
QEFRLPTKTIRSAFASNPLDSTSHETTPPPRTQTVPARDVFHDVQTAICLLIAGVQTREQVSELIQSLQDLQYSEQIVAPPIITHKGRPRSTHITNAREGRQRGGGASGKSHRRQAEAPAPGPPAKKSRVGWTYKCTLCREDGHNRAKCPLQS